MTFTSIPPSLRPVVEDVARAMFERRPAWRGTGPNAEMWTWEKALGDAREYWLDNAEAAILAFLNACVERGLGQHVTPNPVFGGVNHPPFHVWRLPALILNLGATDDTA